MKQRWARTVFSIAVSLACLGVSNAAQEDESQRAFSIPERTEALRRAREVEEHLSAARWPLAIQVLQDMLERDGDALLPSGYRSDPMAPSAHSVFPGAGHWARTQLLALPRDAVKLYRQRFGAAANDSLTMARTELDTSLLVATARNWPLCDSAPRALWILGELEFESGHTKSALIFWRQALDSLKLIQPEVDGQPNPRLAALELRCAQLTQQLRIERAAEDLPLASQSHGKREFDPLESGDLSQARRPLPGRDADHWYTFIKMWPFSSSGSSKVLYPNEHRGRVLVSNSLQVYCLDPFTGREFWHSEEPQGWSELKESQRADLITGLYPEMLQVQPVASGRIVVAALQLAYSALPNRYFREMPVMKAIPQRRLFAFDLETGAALWNHAPELRYDLQKRSFEPVSIDTYAEGMMIAATPVIAGSRILVPSYILEGRIDYQVACYELESGRLLWKTNLISGQRSRNMFGRAMREFCSSPLVVEGQRVIAQTDLGAVAALDLNTGTILWESLYRQTPQRKNQGFTESAQNLTWQTSKPIVIGEYIISAPADSKEIYCYGLEDGRVIWSYDEGDLAASGSSTRNSRFDSLLGADENTIYLGGSQVAALRKFNGLGDRTAFQKVWSQRVNNAQNAPPQLLCEEGVLVPSSERRTFYSRRDGQEIEEKSAPWEFSGTPLLKNGILLTLGRDGLRGYFDWKTLLEQQHNEYRKNPDNYEVALASAQLFTRRSQAALLDNDLFIALDYSKQARSILERMSAQGELDTRTRTLLHQVLVSEALVLERKGDSGSALLQLKRARELAPHGRALRDTLLQEERILRSASSRSAYLDVLNTLESTCGEQPLPQDYLAESRATLEIDEHFTGRIPSIAMWVKLRRAEEHLQSGRLLLAFEDWSGVLAHYGDFPLQGQSAAALVNRRLGRELKQPAGRRAYAAFEARAEALLDSATESKDLAALDQLAKLYPHSHAASMGDRIQVDWAFEQGDLQRLASIVHGARANELENGGLSARLRLAHLLGRAGNGDYERGLLQKLLRTHPKASSDIPSHAGRQVSEVLDNLLAQLPAKADHTPRFQSEVNERRVVLGAHTFLGSMDSPGRPQGVDAELKLYAKEADASFSEPRQGLSRPNELGVERPIQLLAYSSEISDRPYWHIIVEDEFYSQGSAAEASVTTPERLVVGGRLAIHAFDAEGRMVWEHPRREAQRDARHQTRSLVQRDGVLVAWMQDREDKKEFIARAFDLQLGTLLWELPLESNNSRWFAPIIGPEHVVFLSKPYMNPVTAHVIDTFLGTTVGQFELGKIQGQVERFSWIESGNLMVPHFASGSGEKERIAVHDLLSGRELWSQALPAGEDLRNIVRFRGETYVIMVTSQPGHSAGVYRFRPESRSLRRILMLRIGEKPVGINDRELVNLQQPELLLYTSDPALDLRIRVLDLEQERATWTRSLPVEATLVHLPIFSKEHVAIATSSREGRSKKLARLFILERSTGAQKQHIDLNPNLGEANKLELQGLGESIYISGSGSLSRSHLLESINTTEENR